MREAELRSRIRDLLSSGTLPHQLPAAAQMDPSRVVASPHIRVGVQAEEHCFVCGEAKPMVSYTYPDGRVIRLHSACDNVWHEEREGHDDVHTNLNQLGGKLGDSRQLGIIGVPMHKDAVVPGDIAQ